MNQGGDKQATTDGANFSKVRLWISIILGLIAGKLFGLGGVLLILGLFMLWEYLSKKLRTENGNSSSISSSAKTATVTSNRSAVQNDTSVMKIAPNVAKQADTERIQPTDASTMNNQPVNAMPAIAIEPSQQTAQEIENRLYEQIAQEIETNTVDKAIWTRVYAQTSGDEKQTRVAYIKARLEKLMAAENAKLEAIQREKKEIERREQEQRERDHNELVRFEKLQLRINAGKLVSADELGKMADSKDGKEFFNWCAWGQLKNVKEALEKNPHLLLITSNGNTPLHYAVIARQQDVARLLVERGANVQALNEEGKSPIEIAMRSGQAEVAEFLQRFSE